MACPTGLSCLGWAARSGACARRDLRFPMNSFDAPSARRSYCAGAALACWCWCWCCTCVRL
eukprot:360114-Chlamydomonas_euryale.AAC.2